MSHIEQIAPITESDAAKVLEVWERSVRATHHFLSEADVQFLKPLIIPALFGLQHFVGIRDSDAGVIGFVGVDHGKMEALFIDPSYRGQGVGKTLATYATTELGAHSLDVNEQNEQAVGFYLHFGFEVTGRSELDSTGKPFPLLHMRLKQSNK